MVTKVPQRIIASTGVTSGSYTNANITVNSGGQITSASSGTGGGASTDVPKISNLQVTNSTWTVLDDTAVDVVGGYILLTGVNFVSGCLVYIGQTPATSVAFVSSTTVRVTVPQITAGTYPVYLVNPDGGVAIRVPGVTLSASPAWQTASGLTDQYDATAISLQLLATDATSYSIASGSLPPGLTMNSSGLISGTVTGVAVDTTYTFSVVATDAQLQDSPRTFTLTITVSDPYFKLTTLLLTGNSGNNIVTDASTNNFPITVAGDARASNFSPYLTGWSCYFDGTGDYLEQTTATQAFNLSTGDWTISFWIYKTSATNGHVINLYNSSGNTSGLSVWIDSSNAVRHDNGITGAINGGNIVLNTWSFVQLIRSSGTTTLYINGISIATTAQSPNTAQYGRFGTAADGTYPLQGYISNLRIVKGTALSPLVPTTPDTVIANTSLLTCHANRLTDGSANNFAITKNGDVSVVSFNPFNLTNTGTAGSMYFDGTGDYLETAASNSFNLSSGDWTIDAWFYMNATGSYPSIFNIGNANSASYSLLCDQGTLRLDVLRNGGLAFTVATITLNTWYHVAIVSSSGTVRAYLNGVQTGGSTTGGPPSGAVKFSIGGRNYSDIGANAYWNGYISNVRLVKGTAVYTANFTPPTTSLTAIANTQLLTLQNRQPHNNHTFQDASSNNFLITRSGNATQGTFSPFSQTGWGNYFSGSSQYLSFTDTSNNLDLGGSQASFECWVYPISTTNYQMLFKYGGTGDWNTTNGIEYGLSLQSGVVYFYYNSSASAANINSGATTVAANTWTHIAVASNASNALSLYVNGTRVATTTAAITKPTTRTSMRIGADISNYANGYMSNYRFITGSNAYDATLSSITVPTSPVSAVTGTQLLTCQSNRFVDNSTNNFTITFNGSPSVQAFSPFNPSASWSAATYGGSGYFDGNGDWLTIAEATPLQLNSTAFSIELWLYPSSVSANRMIIGKRDTNGGSGYAMSWYIQGNSNGGFIFYSANGSLTSNNNVLIANAWNHIAVTSDGTNVSMYANGSRVNTPTALAVGNSASSIYIGNFPVDNLYYQGNFADVRIQKGAQTYTGTTYTVPTAPLARDANTSLLLNFTNAGIYDATSKNDLETVGDARISTAQSRWGGSSMAFDGTGDYLFGKNNDLLSIASGDFTLEFWVYRSSSQPSTYPRMLTIGAANYSALIFWLSGGSNILVDYSTNGSTWTSNSFGGATLSATTWTHLALVRSSGNLLLFKDGTQQSTSVSNSSFLLATPEIRVATLFNPADNYFAGYLQDLRITRGYARYTANFTPPTAPARLK